MNIVDSSAWLSYFAAEQNAALFARPVEDTEHLLVPSITLTEVFKCIARQRGAGAALRAIAHMEQGKVIPLDSSLAIDAAVVGARHNLPLADSIIYATAQKYDAELWTQDADFEGLAKVSYFARD